MELSRKVSNLKPSVTLEISAKAKAMKRQGIDVIGFGAGEPDFDTPENIKEAAIKAIREGKTKYTPAAGIPELREAVASVFSKDYGVKFFPEEVIISCGGKHSLYNVFQTILNQGDEVIIPAPFWVSYPPLVELAGGIPVIVNSSYDNEFRINVKGIEDAISSKTKAIIINSPSNPSGMMLMKEDLEKLGKLISKRDIFIISDDIYYKLVYEKDFYNILMVDAKFKDKTIIINGVSKTYSMTGWRIGFTLARKDIINGINKIQSQSTSNPCSVSQYAALEAITGDQSSVEVMKRAFLERRDAAVAELNKINGIKCLKPDGTFYLFPDITNFIKNSSISNSVDFCNKLLEIEKVAVVPGSAFGCENAFRMSFAISLENILKGIERIKKFVENF